VWDVIRVSNVPLWSPQEQHTHTHTPWCARHMVSVLRRRTSGAVSTAVGWCGVPRWCAGQLHAQETSVRASRARAAWLIDSSTCYTDPSQGTGRLGLQIGR
jgi:hypothetical protein